MSITQLNVSYSQPEDRLLLRLTTLKDQEFRLWLTRRCVIDFLASIQACLTQTLAEQHQDKPKDEVQHIRATQQQDSFKKAKLKSFEPARQLPLGAEPLLVLSASIAPTSADSASVLHVLKMVLANHKELSIPCATHLLQQFEVVLHHGMSTAQWSPPSSLPSIEPSRSSTLH
jgi:hypothetical protein